MDRPAALLDSERDFIINRAVGADRGRECRPDTVMFPFRSKFHPVGDARGIASEVGFHREVDIQLPEAKPAGLPDDP